MQKRGSVPTSPAEYPRTYNPAISYRAAVYFILPMSAAGMAAILFEERSFGAFFAISIIAVIAALGVICFSEEFIIFDDRIVRRTIRGERSLYRDDIERVEVRQMWRNSKIAYLIPKRMSEAEMAIPVQFIVFDSKFHDWVYSIIGNDADLRDEYRDTYKPRWGGFRAPD